MGRKEIEMSLFQKSGLGNFIRGGQTTMHFMRMIWQVVKEMARVGAIVFVGIMLFTIWIKTTQEQKELSWAWLEAWVKFRIMTLYESGVIMQFPDGTERLIPSRAILRHQGVFDSVTAVYDAWLHGVVFGVLGVFVMGWVGLKFVHVTGEDWAKDEHLRGTKLVDAKTLKKIVQDMKETRGLTVAGIPIPWEGEPSHFLIAGSPGTGKSVTYKEMLATIRSRKERAIVYDPSGEFTELFYREGKDVLLNPMDKRSESWDVWQECQRDYDYEKVAESLIPDSKKADPFWALGARIVFTSITRKMASDPERSNEKLYETIMKMSLKDIIGYVKGTEAGAVIDEQGEKTAQSIRAVLATHVMPFRYLTDTGKGFSIRSWVNNEESDQWIFVTGKDDQNAIIRPLASVWLDTFASSVLSLKPDRSRRIWGVIDELSSLQKLPNLLNTLAMSRKFGNPFVIGIQGYGQLCGIYGNEEADAISGMCSTWAVFRFNEFKSAEWASKNLGQFEQLETNEGISYGVSDIRDGVSLNRARQKRELVLPTDIQFLEDLHGYLKLGRGLPVGSFVAKRVPYPVVAKSYVDRFDGAIMVDPGRIELASSKSTVEICEESGKVVPIRPGVVSERVEPTIGDIVDIEDAEEGDMTVDRETGEVVRKKGSGDGDVAVLG